MKELDLCVRMTKAEFNDAMTTSKIFDYKDVKARLDYSNGTMVLFDDGNWYIKTSGTGTCNQAMGEGWKQVFVTDTITTAGNQDFDANGQPYTATNPAPNAE